MKITPISLRDFIFNENPSHLEEIDNHQITHCADRMGYMSRQALEGRLNKISSSAGKKSYQKLLVFYYALKHAGLKKLANSCRLCLEHLGCVVIK